VVRDIFSEHFERAIVDDEQQHHRLVSFFSRTAPELVDRVEIFEPGRPKKPLFEEYGVDAVIDGLMKSRVDLPSGGYLLIDYAEALTVIDVNSGSFVGRGKQARLEDTITKTNLEAADEVVKQLRLRDIGGIIVIDFIDMARRGNRDAVLKTLRGALAEDRTKTFTAEISRLGLVEMTRQNVTEGVREIMSRPCPTCDGEGVIKSEETIAIEIERRIREIAAKSLKRVEALLVRINPRVSAQFTADGARVLRQLEAETGKVFFFEGSEGLPLDYFEVVEEGKADEIAEHAVPFSAGDEIKVQIIEPHMYNVDDAVAKIDGYVISVGGAGRLVGSKVLVRIEEAGRTSARAVVIGEPEAPAEGNVASDDEAVDSTPRRRGRRGGRRRSAAKATAE
jgi:ribonuclease G